MKYLLLVLSIFLALYMKCSAAQCSVPVFLVNGTVAQATDVNTNFTAAATCANQIDKNNINGNGIRASQIIPTSTGQATFGGSVGYTFVSPVNVTGNLVVGNTMMPTGTVSAPTLTINGSIAAPIVSTTGAGLGAFHMVFITGVIPAGGFGVGMLSVSLTGAAAFTSGGNALTGVPPSFTCSGVWVNINTTSFWQNNPFSGATLQVNSATPNALLFQQFPSTKVLPFSTVCYGF